MNNIIERTWKQGCMVGIEDLRGLTFQNEALAHTFKISGVDTDGNAIALSGTPSGVMLRADNTDVALTCAVSDGCVTAELPAECYDVPGRAGITIFLTSDSKKTAIYAAVVSVARTQSGTAAPGTTASVVDLVNAIETAISQIPASDTNLKGALAATYSNSALYGVGSYAWYDGKLYKCITAITTAETWNSAHWTEAKLANDVCDLKSAFGWESVGKNLCGMIPSHYYPVYLEGGPKLTFSTKSGENLGVSSCVLEVYGEDKSTRLNYYTFPSDKSVHTIQLNSDYHVRYIHWNRTVGQELQVELGDTKTSYEEYWGNAKAFSEKGQDIKYLESITISKNLCGMDINEYYPVNLTGVREFTMSTSDGSNVALSGLYLLLFNANKEQVNYITFNTGRSQKTDYANFTNVKYIRWSRAYPVPLQVELGFTKTDYEPYWGDTKIYTKEHTHNFNLFNTALVDTSNLINDEYVLDLKYLNVANGSVSSTEDTAYQAVEQYIPVEANTDYYFCVFDKAGSPKIEHSALTVCFYNASTDFIFDGGGCYISNGVDGTNCSNENGMMKCTSPATAKYARVCSNTRLYGYKFFLCKKADFDHYANNQAIKEKNISIKNRLNGKKIAIFGDSIMGNTRNYTNIAAHIGENTGMTVYNFGFGGCRMSVHEGNWDLCSMYRIADDIYNEDFSDLVSAVTTGWSGMPGYFVPVAKELNTTDFSGIDAIIIAYGANDYTTPSSVLDNPNNKFDTSTVCGALRYSIRKIQQKYPRIQFIISDPLFRVFLDDTTHEVVYTSENHDFGSGTLKQYAVAFADACKDMLVPFLNLHDEAGFNEYTREYFFQTNDGAHLNEYGNKRIASIIAGKIKSLIS